MRSADPSDPEDVTRQVPSATRTAPSARHTRSRHDRTDELLGTYTCHTQTRARCLGHCRRTMPQGVWGDDASAFVARQVTDSLGPARCRTRGRGSPSTISAIVVRTQKP
jgi:hypothetical protein